MQNKKTLALFDFCDTLIGMQTANRFVTLAYQKNKRFSAVANEFVRVLGRKSGLLFGYRHKKWQLKQITGLSLADMEEISTEYVENFLIPKENKAVVEKMLWHKAQGDTVVIVSGGFSVYIKHYAKKYDIDFVVATDLEVCDGVYTGKIAGLDCMGINKIKKLRDTIDLDQFDMDNSYAYSDHQSDIPLLCLVGRPYVVDFGQDIEWAKLMGYEILNVK